MKSIMSRTLLLVFALLLGAGNAFALGAKGDGMEHKEKGMMTDDSSRKKHDDAMMKQDTMQKETMREDMKQEEESMKKDDGTGGATMNKKDTMKDPMK